MNSIKPKLRGIALAVLAATAFLPQAQATLVSVSPSAQNIALNGTTTVDIVASALTQAVGGFQFDLAFTSSILSGLSFTIDPAFTMGPYSLFDDFSAGFSGGSLNVVYLPVVGISEAALAAAQGASFTLATVSFKGILDGVSPLTLSNVALSEYDGFTTIAGVTTQNGSICVGSNCATPNPTLNAPEPASMLLVATALGALGLRRRKAA